MAEDMIEVEALAKALHDAFAKERGLKLWDEDDDDAPQKDIYRVKAQRQIAEEAAAQGEQPVRSDMREKD